MKRLEKIKYKILLDYPFYGYFLIKTKFEHNNHIPTAETNGETIRFNKDFIDSLTDKQLITVILHELKHIIYCHHLRLKGKDRDIWNEATDYVINYQLIEEEGQEYIKGILLENSFRNMASEQIYHLLKRNQQQTRKEKENERNDRNATGDSGNSNGKSSGNRKSDSGTGKEKGRESNETNSTNAEETRQYNGNNDGSRERGTRIGDFRPPKDGVQQSEQIEKMKEEIIRAINYASKIGKMPANLERQLRKFLKPQISWETLLANWINDISNDDYSWLHRDYRVLDNYFPSLHTETLGKLAIVIDVSGSVDNQLLDKFISEINNLKEKFEFECVLLTFDIKVRKILRLGKTEKIENFSTQGGGGTYIKPVFDFLETERGITGCIIFTDMQVIGIPRKFEYETLWLNYGPYQNTTNFGRIINIRR